jgi:hypothetical protein
MKQKLKSINTFKGFNENLEKFKQDLYDYLNSNDSIEPIEYYKFSYKYEKLQEPDTPGDLCQYVKYENQISIPVYQIQNFLFFVVSDHTLWEYEPFANELNKLKKWANDLKYLSYNEVADYEDWQPTIKELFKSETILDSKALSDAINSIFKSIFQLDRWFLGKLEHVNNPVDVFELSLSVKAKLFHNKFNLSKLLFTYTCEIKLNLSLFDEGLVKKYSTFWEVVFNSKRFRKFGYNLEIRPIYTEIIRPALKEIRENTDNIEQKELLPPQQNTKQKSKLNETELSEKVKKHFGFLNGNCPRKHKQILKDEDFENLIEWTIKYFENDFEVPEISEPIKVVNTNKTFVQLAFKYLFKELHKSSPYPDTLFELYKSVFIPYSEDKKSNFEAVKNNDEVKKLMQIDY